jgi:hypothetical protein
MSLTEKERKILEGLQANDVFDYNISVSAVLMSRMEPQREVDRIVDLHVAAVKDCDEYFAEAE